MGHATALVPTKQSEMWERVVTSGQQFQPLIDKLYSLDGGIRYAGLINAQGVLLAGGLRVGTKSLDSDAEEKLRLRQLATAGVVSRIWERAYGKCAYTIMRFQNLLVAQFPYRDLTMIVSMAPNIRMQVVDQISDILVRNS
jgi:hypothetical protein